MHSEQKQDRQCTDNTTLWHICITTAAMEMKQYDPFALMLTYKWLSTT